MTEIMIRADEQLVAVLEQIATQQGLTFEQVIQQALTDWVSEYRKSAARQYSFIGIGRSGRSDLSLRAEEILAEQAVLVGMRRFCLGLILSLMLLCGSIPCLAQSQNPATSGKEERSADDTLIACQFGEPITIEVWVRDRESKEVETLDKDNFFIVEGGVTQQIIFWLREETLEKGILRFKYKIGYLPANEALDGQYRRVQVGVQTKNNARLNVYSWPRGYYAKREGTESSTNDANGKKKP